MNNQDIAQHSPRLNVLLVPGLFSPRWLMRPMGYFLSKRFDSATVWDHPHWLGDVQSNVDALEDQWCRLDPMIPFAVVTHSFGDWIVRELMSRRGLRQPSHLVSIAPVVTNNAAASLVGKLVGDRIGEVSIMRDRDLASKNLCVPPTVRHLAIWPRMDLWIQKRDFRSPQTICQNVWATHNSAPVQIGVMNRVERFLKCQTVSQSRSEAAFETVYHRVPATVTSRQASRCGVFEQNVA